MQSSSLTWCSDWNSFFDLVLSSLKSLTLCLLDEPLFLDLGGACGAPEMGISRSVK